MLSTSVRDVQVSGLKRPSEYETVVRDKESAKMNIKVAEQGTTFKLTLSTTHSLQNKRSMTHTSFYNDDLKTF